MRSSYTKKNINEDDDHAINKFESELEEFIREYKEYNRKNNKLGNV